MIVSEEDCRLMQAVDEFVQRTLRDAALRENPCERRLGAHLDEVARRHGFDPRVLQERYCSMIESL